LEFRLKGNALVFCSLFLAADGYFGQRSSVWAGFTTPAVDFRAISDFFPKVRALSLIFTWPAYCNAKHSDLKD
jgi:hypothetical protein